MFLSDNKFIAWGKKIERALLTLPPILPNKAPQKHAAETIKTWIFKLPEYHTTKMFRFSEKYGSAPSTPEDSPSKWTSRSKLRSWNTTPRRIVYIILALFSLVVLSTFLSLSSSHGVSIIFLSLATGCFRTHHLILIASSSSLPYTNHTLQCQLRP